MNADLIFALPFVALLVFALGLNFWFARERRAAKEREDRRRAARLEAEKLLAGAKPRRPPVPPRPPAPAARQVAASPAHAAPYTSSPAPAPEPYNYVSSWVSAPSPSYGSSYDTCSSDSSSSSSDSSSSCSSGD